MTDFGKYPIAELLPHRPPMVMIKSVIGFSLENSEVETLPDVSESNVFYRHELGGVPACAALEFMAQTIGCFAGLAGKAADPNFKQGIGFVLGSRKLELNIDKFDPNTRYTVKAVKCFFDDEMASFDCSVYDANRNTVASGLVNVFRPKNTEDFINRL